MKNNLFINQNSPSGEYDLHWDHKFHFTCKLRATHVFHECGQISDRFHLKYNYKYHYYLFPKRIFDKRFVYFHIVIKLIDIINSYKIND